MRLKLLTVLLIVICSCDFVNCLSAKMGRALLNGAINSFKEILKIEDFNEQESCVMLFCVNVLHEPVAELLNETKEYLCKKSFAISKQEYIALDNRIPRNHTGEQCIMELDLHAPWKEVKNYAINRFLQMRLSDLLKNFILLVKRRVDCPVSQPIRQIMRRQLQSAVPIELEFIERHTLYHEMGEPNLPIMSGIPIDKQEEKLGILRDKLSRPLGNNQLHRFSRTVPRGVWGEQ